MTEDHLAYIEEYLPKYLSVDQQKSLSKILSEEFPRTHDPNKIYRQLDEIDTFYQGDGIIDIPFASLNAENQNFDLENISGAILSNTCDIAGENERNFMPYVNLAAIYTLDEFTVFLESIAVSKDKITSFIENVRSNILTTLFYLPELKKGNEIILPESFIRFDHTTAIPIDFINEGKYDKNYTSDNGDRIFTFSNYGFYVFLFKLSIHYCRIREGVFRN